MTHKAALASDWLIFFSSMAQMKITPRKEEKGKPKEVKMRAEVHAQPQEPPVPVDPPVPEMEVPPTPQETERRMAEVEKLGRWEVTRVITDPTVGPDGCGGWAIYVGWGVASPE